MSVIPDGPTHHGVTSSDWANYYLYQDGLMWRRLQLLGTIQVAALAGAYALMPDKPVALSILSLGIFLSLIIFLLLRRDQAYRIYIEGKIPEFEMRVPRIWDAPLRGREIIWILFFSLVIADAILWRMISIFVPTPT